MPSRVWAATAQSGEEGVYSDMLPDCADYDGITTVGPAVLQRASPTEISESLQRFLTAVRATKRWML